MSFNTIPFLLFLPAAAILYYVLPRRAKNGVLLALSAAFYLFGTTPGYVVFLVTAVLVVWLCGRAMEHCKSAAAGRRILWAGILLNLLILCFFKYNRFFAEPLAASLSAAGFPYVTESNGVFRLLMPLGISYFTFQSIGYLVDVSRGKTPVEHNLIDLALFLSFFPQITAGPIGRADELLPQFKAPRRYDGARTVAGLRLMLLGYFKKIAVADMLALFVDTVYASPTSYSGLTLTAAAVLYLVYLYCDFSGYSDIARGCGKIFGIELRENFRTPLLSAGFVELWRRWHISFSEWLRDYVYIGLLGGNRKGTARKYLNLFLTFVISGLWHGVGLTFLVWGALQGLFQMVEYALTRHDLLRREPHGPARGVRTVLVFVLNVFAFIPFRAANLSEALYITLGQFRSVSLAGFAQEYMRAVGTGFNATGVLIAGYTVFCVAALFLLVRLDCLRCYRLGDAGLEIWLGSRPRAVRWLLYYLFLAFILAAFIMRNGNYVGNVSFAYGGF